MKVSDLIYSGFRISGILAEAQRGLGLAEAADGLLCLNSLIDSWKAERLMVYNMPRTVFPIVPNKPSYTIGSSGADLTLERPERIEAAGLIFSTTSAPYIEQPLRILTVQEWQGLSPKSMSSTVPYMLYYEPQVPNGVIYLWPVPSVANQFALYTWQTVSEFADPDATVVLPPAYRRAIEYNLAQELAVRFPNRQKLSPVSMEEARKAKAAIKSVNAVPAKMICEAANMGGPGSRGRWDITTNQWR